MADRTPHIPDEERRQKVMNLSIIGTRQDAIADIMGIDPKTLRKHYRHELDHGATTSTAAVGGNLYRKAMDGDTAAMIFWMKTRGGWSERQLLEHTSPDGSMTPTVIRIMGPEDEE